MSEEKIPITAFAELFDVRTTDYFPCVRNGVNYKVKGQLIGKNSTTTPVNLKEYLIDNTDLDNDYNVTLPHALGERTLLIVIMHEVKEDDTLVRIGVDGILELPDTETAILKFGSPINTQYSVSLFAPFGRRVASSNYLTEYFNGDVNGANHYEILNKSTYGFNAQSAHSAVGFARSNPFSVNSGDSIKFSYTYSSMNSSENITAYLSDENGVIISNTVTLQKNGAYSANLNAVYSSSDAYLIITGGSSTTNYLYSISNSKIEKQ